jgi:hypothetical protein
LTLPRRVAALEFSRGLQTTVVENFILPVASATIEFNRLTRREIFAD